MAKFRLQAMHTESCLQAMWKCCTTLSNSWLSLISISAQILHFYE